MKHAVKILVVVLVLLTLSSCSPFSIYWQTSSGNQQTSSGSSKLVLRTLPEELKAMFSSIPKGLFFTTDRYAFGGLDERDVILVSPDLKTQVNLTKGIHRINKDYVCTLSSDCKKLLIRYENNFTIYNEKGDILYSDHPIFLSGGYKYYYHSDDLNYVVYNYDNDDTCTLVNVNTKQETKEIFSGTVTRMDNDYVCFDCPDDSNISHIYNIKTGKLMEIRNCSYILDIENNIVLFDVVKQALDAGPFGITYFHLDLTTNTRTKVDKEKVEYKIPDISPNGIYSAIIVTPSEYTGLDEFYPGIHITNVITKEERILKSDEEPIDGRIKKLNYTDFHWVEKK